MIYETLAAMADWLDNRRFDFGSSEAQVKAVLDDFRGGNVDNVVDDVTNSGTLTLSNEVLTIDGTTLTNDKNSRLDDYLVGMQDKTPRKVLEDNIAPDVFRA